MSDTDCFCANESPCMHQSSKEEATGETDKMRKAAKLKKQTEESHWERANRRGRFKGKGEYEMATKKYRKCVV